MSSNTTFKINWSQVVTSLFIGGVVGGVSILRLADTNTIVLAEHTRDIAEFQETAVLRPEYEANNLSIQRQLDEIKKSLDRVERKLDSL